METLRFAPIIRVSTEKQEKQGESLNTQTKQIIQYVEYLHGTIPEHCWNYKGQEHATPGQERTRLEQLLNDAGKNIFDAVIVCDASRWSRDNAKSKAGLDILRMNKIRFFVGTSEFDLYNPAQNLFLGMSAEIGEYQAREQALKSIINRINIAKGGKPASGMLPHGRTWDKVKGWDVDLVKKQIIEQCAERYLKGDSFKTIAHTYNMDFTNLWTILNTGCGTEWHCKFVNKDVNVDETVIMKIPPLLDDDIIEAIHQKGIAKRTYNHGEIKNRYLLSRMIFCLNCGFTMTGFTSASGRKYYRHARYDRLECKSPKWVYAAELENSVLIHLIRTLGDVERINNAIKLATPDLSKVKSLEKEQTNLTNELKKITIQKDKVIDKVAEGLLTDTEVKTKLDKLRAREDSIHTRLIAITEELNSVPDPVKVKRLTALGIKVLRDVTQNSPEKIFKKSYEWKRNLIEHAFAGTDVRGKRLGVYVDKTEDGWRFEIRGILESTILQLPLSDQYLIDAFHLDSEYQDIKEELRKIREDVSSLGRQSLKQTSYTINGTIDL